MQLNKSSRITCQLNVFCIELSEKQPRTLRTGRPIPQGLGGKLLTTSLWLNNNSLNSMRLMTQAVKDIFQYPSKMTWIDFSFNNLEDIDEVCSNYICIIFNLDKYF